MGSVLVLTLFLVSGLMAWFMSSDRPFQKSQPTSRLTYIRRKIEDAWRNNPHVSVHNGGDGNFKLTWAFGDTTVVLSRYSVCSVWGPGEYAAIDHTYCMVVDGAKEHLEIHMDTDDSIQICAGTNSVWVDSGSRALVEDFHAIVHELTSGVQNG